MRSKALSNRRPCRRNGRWYNLAENETRKRTVLQGPILASSSDGLWIFYSRSGVVPPAVVSRVPRNM